MEIFLFFLIISSLIGIITLWIYILSSHLILLLIASAAFVFSGTMLVKIIDYNKPTALDVYRGNTTLEITYRSNIPIDTIVVFKDQ